MRKLIVVCVVCLCGVLSGCVTPEPSCPRYTDIDMTPSVSYAMDSHLPFQFPLDDEDLYNPNTPFMTVFAEPAVVTDIKYLKYHAAEDYAAPPGTPVYAIADGQVSFSGRMGGYGWLVIVDHPQANLYSLYGHLSPSRWSIGRSQVQKGDLLGYLGDGWENGGSRENPLIPHLHFGIRTGQRSTYPSDGEWRWMAGWIKLCPQELGWLQPSVVITQQEIPENGYGAPQGKFLEKWSSEFLFTAIYIIGAGCMLVFAIRKDKPVAIILYGILITAASGIFFTKGWKMSYMLIVLGPALIAWGLYQIIQHKREDIPA